MSVDKKRKALEEEIAAERASVKKVAPQEKPEAAGSAKPKTKLKGKELAPTVRPKFVLGVAAAVLLVVFGLLAGPSIGRWLDRSYQSFFGSDEAPLVAEVTEAPPAITLSQLKDQVDALAAKLQAVEQQELPDLAALMARLRELETRVATAAGGQAPLAASPDPAAAETKALVEVLAERLSALEARKVDASGNEGLSLVSALLLERVEAGRPFRVELIRIETLLASLSLSDRTIVSDHLAILRPHARSGVVSQQAIREDFSALIFETLTASGRFGEDSEWDKIWAEFTSLVVIRRTGDVTGDDLESRLARAEFRLSMSDLAAALEEVGAIEAVARAPLEGWLADARMRLNVVQAAAALELLIDQATRARE